MKQKITWSTQLFTRHCLHETRSFRSIGPSPRWSVTALTYRKGLNHGFRARDLGRPGPGRWSGDRAHPSGGGQHRQHTVRTGGVGGEQRRGRLIRNAMSSSSWPAVADSGARDDASAEQMVALSVSIDPPANRSVARRARRPRGVRRRRRRSRRRAGSRDRWRDGRSARFRPRWRPRRWRRLRGRSLEAPSPKGCRQTPSIAILSKIASVGRGLASGTNWNWAESQGNAGLTSATVGTPCQALAVRNCEVPATSLGSDMWRMKNTRTPAPRAASRTATTAAVTCGARWRCGLRSRPACRRRPAPSGEDHRHPQV